MGDKVVKLKPKPRLKPKPKIWTNAVEVIARAVAAYKCGLSNRGEKLPDDLWKQTEKHAEVALEALVESGYNITWDDGGAHDGY